MKNLYRLSSFLLAACLALPCFGQATLIKDICPGGCGSYPNNLTAISSTLYFSATNGQSGQELYKSNGTAAGTVLIKDIYPGKSGSSPAQFTPCNGKVFFTASNGTSGAELWKTDGTANGTTMVKDIWPGGASSNISKMVVISNVLYFVANDGAHGLELWKSDGTAAGTVLVKDFRAGIADGAIQSMANFQNKLLIARSYIGADNYSVDCQLWKYDPTSKVISTLFGVKGKYIDLLTVHNGNLYYGLGDFGEFVDVFKLNADQKGGSFFYIVPTYHTTWIQSLGGKLLVASSDEYFPLAVRIVDNNGHAVGSLSDGVQDVTAVTSGLSAGSIYFSARNYEDTNAPDDAYSVYKNAKTTALATFKGKISNIEALGNQIFFSAYNSTNGAELRFITPSNAREAIAAEEPATFKLYPNPASTSATAEFTAEETGTLSLSLYDLRGNRIESLFQAEMNAGETRQQPLDVSPYESGLYMVRMNNGKRIQYQKLTIFK